MKKRKYNNNKWNLLPTDTIELILSYLLFVDYISVGSCNKELRRLTMELSYAHCNSSNYILLFEFHTKKLIYDFITYKHQTPKTIENHNIYDFGNGLERLTAYSNRVVYNVHVQETVEKYKAILPKGIVFSCTRAKPDENIGFEAMVDVEVVIVYLKLKYTLDFDVDNTDDPRIIISLTYRNENDPSITVFSSRTILLQYVPLRNIRYTKTEQTIEQNLNKLIELFDIKGTPQQTLDFIKEMMVATSILRGDYNWKLQDGGRTPTNHFKDEPHNLWTT